MAFTCFDSSTGGLPPTINVSGFTVSTWTTVTQASLVAGMKAAIILIRTTGNTTTVGIRRTGDSGFTFTGTIQANSQAYLITGLDGSQNFDLNLSQLTGVVVYVYGALGSEFVPVNATTLTTLTTAFANYNLTSQTAANAVAAVLYINGTGYGVAFRFGASGASSDNFSNTNESASFRSYIVGLDGSQNMQGIAGNTSQVPILVGYLTGGITWHTNAANVTPASSGSFQTLVPAGGDVSPTGFIFDNKLASGAYTYSLSEVGSGLALGLQSTGALHEQAVGPASSQINMSNIATNTLYELGYFMGQPPPLDSNQSIQMPGPGLVEPFGPTQFSMFPYSNFIAPAIIPPPLQVGLIQRPGPGVGPSRFQTFQQGVIPQGPPSSSVQPSGPTGAYRRRIHRWNG